MKCPEARTRIPLLHSDELTVAEITGLVEHLAVCAACHELEAKETAALLRVRAALSSGIPDAPAVAAASRQDEFSSWWPAGALAASVALCLAVLAYQGAFDTQPVLDTRITLEMEILEFGTATWTPLGLKRNDRTPVVDAEQLESLATSARQLDQQGITSVLESMVPEAVQTPSPSVIEAARTRSPLADAMVPCREATAYELTLADAKLLGLTVPERSITRGGCLRGRGRDTLTVVRSGQAVCVLVSRGPRSTFANLSSASRLASEH